jgi:hypothetical protein
MHKKEHVHIISAGEKSALSYPAAFRVLPTITRACILAAYRQCRTRVVGGT